MGYPLAKGISNFYIKRVAPKLRAYKVTGSPYPKQSSNRNQVRSGTSIIGILIRLALSDDDRGG